MILQNYKEIEQGQIKMKEEQGINKNTKKEGDFLILNFR